MEYYDWEYRAEVAKENRAKQADTYEEWLIWLLKEIDEQEGWTFPKDLKDWWKEKKDKIAKDRERQEREEARRKARESGLAKLTLEEREALNLRYDAKLGNRR